MAPLACKPTAAGWFNKPNDTIGRGQNCPADEVNVPFYLQAVANVNRNGHTGRRWPVVTVSRNRHVTRQSSSLHCLVAAHHCQPHRI